MMPARLDSVAKYICDKGEWQVTNLQVQKLLYLAQMIYMGRTKGSKLVDGYFEAWDFGPVEPSLYRKVRMFGKQPIQDVFFNARPFKETDSRRNLLDEICEALLQKRPSELVEITHWENGAWARHYEPGVKGIRIPDADICAEYSDRLKAGVLRDN